MMSKCLIVSVVLATLLAFCGRTECAEVSGNSLPDLSNVIKTIETQIQNVLNMLQNGLNILPPEIRTIVENILNFIREVLTKAQTQISQDIVPKIQDAVQTFGPLLSNLIPGKK